MLFSVSEDPDKDAQPKKINRTNVIIACVAIILLAVVIALGVGDKRASVYREFLRFLEAGEYKEAQSMSWRVDSNYRDSKALENYCHAQYAYQRGMLDKARHYLSYLSYYGALSGHPSLQNDLAELKEAVERDYPAFLEKEKQRQQEEERKRKEVEKKRQQEEKKKAASGVPYVGMPEEYIDITMLGKPSPTVRHNTGQVGQTFVSANLYDFYQNGKYIFTARCMEGKVTEVWDYRNKDIGSFDPQSPPSRSSSSSSSSRFRVEDFVHPDDFYEYYYDDFVDFEEAEDYYYSHGG